MYVYLACITKRFIDFGCGQNKKEGFYGVNDVETQDTDKVIDLEKDEWPLPSNHFKIVWLNQVAEHIESFYSFMSEVHRITDYNGKVVIKVPYYLSSYQARIDHENQFCENTLDELILGRDDGMSYVDSYFELVELERNWNDFIFVRMLRTFLPDEVVARHVPNAVAGLKFVLTPVKKEDEQS